MTLTPDQITDAQSLQKARSRWWLEVIYILALYGIYSAVRNFHGSHVSETSAVRHAYDIIDIQKTLRLVNELDVQQFFLPHEWFIKFLNVWYGTAHFVVTIGILIWLFRHQVARYVHWRNVIFATSGLALIGYVIYPLAPPRLLPDSYGFVDTLETIGGLWSFESETVQDLSNQYATMPSLHVGWALWCAFAVMPVLRHTWSRLLISCYPALTILAIVATANHFWLDVVGGLVVFALGYVVATAAEKARWRKHQRPGPNLAPGDVSSSA